GRTGPAERSADASDHSGPAGPAAGSGLRSETEIQPETAGRNRPALYAAQNPAGHWPPDPNVRGLWRNPPAVERRRAGTSTSTASRRAGTPSTALRRMTMA